MSVFHRPLFTVGPRLSEVSCHLSYLRPITDSNRIPSYQASATEPESNWHFLSPCDGCALLVSRADLGRWHSTTGSSVPDFPLASSHGLSAHQGVSSLKFQRVSTAHSPTLATTSHDMSAHHHNGSKSQSPLMLALVWESQWFYPLAPPLTKEFTTAPSVRILGVLILTEKKTYGNRSTADARIIRSSSTWSGSPEQTADATSRRARDCNTRRERQWSDGSPSSDTAAGNGHGGTRIRVT